MSTQRKQVLTRVAVFAVALVIALWAPFFNGFPLVYWDTGTYLKSSFEFTVPPDRPVFYGLWLALWRSLFGTSLWFPLVAQTSVVLGLAALCLRAAGRPLWFLLILALVSNGTWYWGQIMPDAFSGGVALCLGLLLFAPIKEGRERFLVWLCLVFFVAVHYSHGLIAALVLAAVACWAVGSGRWRAMRVRLLRSALAVTAGFTLLLSVNALMTGRVFFSESAPVFYTARLIQSGLLKRFLKEQCHGPESYDLCGDAAFFESHSADEFLWDEAASPLYTRCGGWQHGGARLAPIVRRALVAYPVENFTMAVTATLQQLSLCGTGDGFQEPYSAGHRVFQQVRDHMPSEFGSFQRSRLQRARLWPTVSVLSTVYNVLGVLALLFVLHRRRALGAALLLFFVSSAVVTGALSFPIERMQGRLLWLWTLAALLVLPRMSRVVSGK